MQENTNPQQALADQKKALDEEKARALADQKKALDEEKARALAAQKQALDEEKARALAEQKQAGLDFGPAAETEKPRTCKSGKWRATKGCTWQGKFVKEGTIVSAEVMDNPHFEEVAEVKTAAGREPR